ncbi:MAG: hypothetical protein PHE54_03025 [Bacilli bacterium]|nr:hypothetical protein [Bacilli bacterium]
MDESFLETIDFENIHKIIDLTKALERLYKILYELEINGQKNSDIYYKKLNSLITLINYEAKIYEDTDLNEKKCLKILAFLKQKYSLDLGKYAAYDYFYDGLIKQEIDDQALYRVIKKLFNKYQTNHYLNIVAMDGLLEHKALMTEINKQKIVTEAIYDDINNLFLIILEKTINDNNLPYQHLLKKLKYHFGFMFKNSEKKLISDAFIVPLDAYITSKMVADFNQMSEESYNILKHSCVINLCIQALKRLRIIIKSNSDSNNISFTIISCLIRATFQMMDGNLMTDAQAFFNQYMNSDIDLVNCDNSEKIKAYLEQLYKQIGEDHSEVKIVSLKSPN